MPAPPPPSAPMGVRDISDYYGVSLKTTYHWIERPDFPAPSCTVNRTTRLWSFGKLDLWATEHGVTIGTGLRIPRTKPAT